MSGCIWISEGWWVSVCEFRIVYSGCNKWRVYKCEKIIVVVIRVVISEGWWVSVNLI